MMRKVQTVVCKFLAQRGERKATQSVRTKGTETQQGRTIAVCLSKESEVPNSYLGETSSEPPSAQDNMQESSVQSILVAQGCPLPAPDSGV